MVKCLSSSHKDLSSVPQYSHKNLGVVVCICNTITGEEETEGPLKLVCHLVFMNGASIGSARDPTLTSGVNHLRFNLTSSVYC